MNGVKKRTKGRGKMLRQMALPERDVSAATLEVDGKRAFILAKNGSRVSLITKENGQMIKSNLWNNYRDAFAPFISRVGDRIAVFAAKGNTPVLRPIGEKGGIILRSPYLKRARVSGRALEFKGRALVPALGVPYGCKFSSAVVFASEDAGNSWYLLSLVLIAEDFGYPVVNFRIARKGDELIGLVETLPLRTVHITRSRDGESWSKPRFAGIIGANSIPLVVKDELFIMCSNEKYINLYRQEKLFKRIEMEKAVKHLDAFCSRERITAVATLEDGEGRLIEFEI